MWRFIRRKQGPDYHRLKTMVKRSIEQYLRNRNFEARNGNYERNAVVKNQETKQRGQTTLGWQWEANGQCSKGDKCSFRHDVFKRAKMTQPNPSSRTRSPRGKSPSGRMFRLPYKGYLKGTRTNSFCEKWHLQNACCTRPRVAVDLEKSALMRIARLMNSLAKGPKRMVTKVQRTC